MKLRNCILQKFTNFAEKWDLHELFELVFIDGGIGCILNIIPGLDWFHRWSEWEFNEYAQEWQRHCFRGCGATQRKPCKYMEDKWKCLDCKILFRYFLRCK